MNAVPQSAVVGVEQSHCVDVEIPPPPAGHRARATPTAGSRSGVRRPGPDRSVRALFHSSRRGLVARGVCIAGILAVLLAASAAAAQEAPAQEAPAEALEPREESFRPNELALVFASTYEAEGGGNFFTIGLEYERRFTPWLGISGTYEYVTDVGASVFAFPVTLRVWRALKLLAGPGFEHVTRRAADEGEDGLEEGEGGDNLFLVRVGAQYAFELGERFSIVPGIELDLVDESEGVATALVYGVNFAIAF